MFLHFTNIQPRISNQVSSIYSLLTAQREILLLDAFFLINFEDFRYNHAKNSL